mmetsp:Transcript_19374/g.27279  ORF Transcript_19374/g.27279 Transcript_19374/m.27279 type:complete len:99 (-) Transcript_19374:1053-1349(-)
MLKDARMEPPNHASSTRFSGAEILNFVNFPILRTSDNKRMPKPREQVVPPYDACAVTLCKNGNVMAYRKQNLRKNLSSNIRCTLRDSIYSNFMNSRIF